MQDVAYIIPGFGESRKTRGYDRIDGLFRTKGIRPVHVKIDWHARAPRSFKDYIHQFRKQYKRPAHANVYVLGFSYGAVTALLAEPATHPDVLILCSLSPYFKEDLAKLKPRWLAWWRKNFKDSDHSFGEIAPKIKARTFLIAGDKEGPELERRVRSARRTIKRSSLTIARGAKHSIGQKEYLVAVQKVIDRL